MSFWISNFYRFWNCEKLKSRRRAPEHDEDPRKTIFKLFDMNVISIKKHEMDIW